MHTFKSDIDVVADMMVVHVHDLPVVMVGLFVVMIECA